MPRFTLSQVNVLRVELSNEIQQYHNELARAEAAVQSVRNRALARIAEYTPILAELTSDAQEQDAQVWLAPVVAEGTQLLADAVAAKDLAAAKLAGMTG